MQFLRKAAPVLVLVAVGLLALRFQIEKSPVSVATEKTDSPIPGSRLSTGGNTGLSDSSASAAGNLAEVETHDAFKEQDELSGILKQFPIETAIDPAGKNHPSWPSAEILAVGESRKGERGLFRRVTLLQPVDLPYPVRVEEMISLVSGGREKVEHVTEMVADRYILRPAVEIDPLLMQKIRHSGGAIRRISATGIYRVELASFDFDTVPAAVDSHRENSSIHYAEPDYIVHLMQEPDDPDYLNGQLWGMHNTGQDSGVEDADMDAPEGWDIRTDASNIVIGIVDTGVRYTHEDIAANMWVNPGEDGPDAFGNSKRDNGIDDDGNGYIDDVHGINAVEGTGNPVDSHGHGSHTAGTAAAVGNNGKGVTGVAWKAKIMALKFLGGSGGSSSDAVICIDYAIQNGAHLTSNSWGGQRLTDAVREIIEAANDAGQLFVAAAGNSTADNDISDTFPADYPIENIISVSAINRLGELASFSNYGAGSVHLAAPGQKILSLDNTSDTAYQDLSGTSMAAPAVAGLAALVMAEFPGEDHMAAKNRILSGAQPSEALEGTSLTGATANVHGALITNSPAPFNDDFSNAMEILTDPQVIHANNRHATREPGEPVPPRFGTNTVWYKIVAKVSGQTIVNTSGSSFDTTLAVYTGDTLKDLTLVGSNDDYEGSTFSRVDFQGIEGTVYHIAVAGKDNQSGFIKLTASGPPVEDFLEDALAVPNFPFTYRSDNTNASREPNEPEHAGQPGGGSLWLKLRLADFGLASQEIILSSENSEFDTLLAVYRSEGGPLTMNSLVPVASNDDAPYGDTSSEVSFLADAQTTYYVVTDGKQNARGLVRLAGRNKSTNDDFADPIVLSGESVRVTIPSLELRWATREPDEPNHDNASGGTSLWYQWSPPSAGKYEISTDAGTAIGIYSGSSLASLVTEATDQSDGSGSSRAVLANADPASIYRIAVDSRADRIILQDIELVIRPFTTHPNDLVANAHTLTGSPTTEIPLEWSTDNSDASLEAGEPGSSPYQSVWLKWTATESGRFQLETNASTADNSFLVYSGPANATSFAQLQPHGWLHVYRMTFDLWTEFDFIEGTTYYFRLGSLYESESSSFTVRLAPFSPPLNDDFANAEVITEFFAARRVRNFGATRTGFEPRHSTDNLFFNNSDEFAKDSFITYSTLWYKWSPSSPEQARRTTASSFFSRIGSVVAVYEADSDPPSVLNLTQVTPGSSSMYYYWWNTGEVSWDAEYGKTYYIVLGADSERNQGEQYLSIWQNPNDNFSQRETLPSTDTLTIHTANFAATREQDEPRIDSVEFGGRSIWYEWTAPRSGIVAFDTYGSHVESDRDAFMQIGIYKGETLAGLQKVASNAGVSMRDDNAMTVMKADAGQSYKIVLDALNGPESGTHKTEWTFRTVIQFNISTGSVANDDLANARRVTGDFHQEFIDLKFASTEPGEPSHGGRTNRSAWWKWTAPDSGTWWVSTSSDIFDTQDNRKPGIAVYGDIRFGSGYDPLYTIASNNNDSANSNYTPALTAFEAVAGETYYFAVADGGAVPTHSGYKSGFMLARAAPNDNFEAATEITGSRRTVKGHNLGATWQTGEPQIDSWGTDENQRSVWWKWTAPAAGLTTVTTNGSYIYNELAVYRGDALNSLIEVTKEVTGGSFDNGFSYEERADMANRTVTFNATAGITYYFMVVGSGYENTSYGPITLTVTGQPGQPFAPSDPDSRRLSASSIRLTWRDNAVDESAYVIHKAPDPAGTWREVFYSGEADTTNWTDFTATEGTWYRIRAEGPGGASEWAQIFVPGPPDPDTLASINQWRLYYFGSADITEESADMAIPLDDGMTNLMKFALGGTPWTPAADLVPFLKIEAIDGMQYPVFYYRRHAGAGNGSAESGYRIHGLNYVVKVAGNSANEWSTGTGLLEQIGSPTPNGDGTETVRVKVAAPVVSTPSTLVRLEVNQD